MKIERVCEWCGKKFSVYPSVVKNGGGKTCSRSCKDKWHSKYVRGENHPLSKPKAEIKCAYCGKTKKVFPCRTKKEFLFCDTKCQAEWQRENRSGENHPCWKGGGMEVRCANCGAIKHIALWEKRRNQNHFCDLQCRAEWMSKNLQGENNPSWDGGISFEPYPPQFNRTLRRKIRERDQFTCVVCGNKGRLVHHIDYDKKNNRANNLVTVCRSCHGKTNFNREEWMVLFGLWIAGCPVHDPEGDE